MTCDSYYSRLDKFLALRLNLVRFWLASRFSLVSKSKSFLNKNCKISLCKNWQKFRTSSNNLEVVTFARSFIFHYFSLDYVIKCLDSWHQDVKWLEQNGKSMKRCIQQEWLNFRKSAVNRKLLVSVESFTRLNNQRNGIVASEICIDRFPIKWKNFLLSCSWCEKSATTQCDTLTDYWDSKGTAVQQSFIFLCQFQLGWEPERETSCTQNKRRIFILEMVLLIVAKSNVCVHVRVLCRILIPDLFICLACKSICAAGDRLRRKSIDYGTHLLMISPTSNVN